MPLKISPSILSADFGRLAAEVAAVEAAGADWIHIDVMDGHFVPNLTIGPPVVACLRKVTGLPLDTHLMVANADSLLEDFAAAGADYLTVHVEACLHLDRTLNRIRELGMQPGVTLNPATPLAHISQVLSLVDLVLIMSVNPGFSGQSFIAYAVDKVAELRRLRDRQGLDFLIQVDGGVNPGTVGKVAAAGAQVVVAGSAVFGQGDYAQAIKAIREAAAAG